MNQLRRWLLAALFLLLSSVSAEAGNYFIPPQPFKVTNGYYLRITNNEATTKRARCIYTISSGTGVGTASAVDLNITTGSTGDCQPASGVEWTIHAVVHEGDITLSHYDGTNAIAFATDPAAPTTDDLYQINALCQGEPSSPPSGKTSWYCDSGNSNLFTVKDSSGNIHILGPETKQIYFGAGGINVDGTNCAVPTEQNLNSSEKTWAFSCADSNSSVFSGKVRMPLTWDGGTITFTLALFHDTTETITFAGDFSAQCRAAGTAINSTYGTAVAADVAITTANQIAEATTAAVTPNGSCVGGAWLLWRYVVDATNFSTNAANSKVLGVTIHAVY